MHALPPSAAGSSHAVKPQTISEASYPAAVLGDSPLAYYRLDDTGSTLSDASPHGIAGAYGSAVQHNIPSLVSNNIDPAAQFPGGTWSASGIATVAHNATLQPSSAVSVEAWIWLKNPDSGRVDVVSYGDQTLGASYALSIQATHSLLFTVATSVGTYSATGGTVLTPGTAYHVVGVYDGSAVKLYVNSVLDGSATASGTLSYAHATTYGLSIGAGQDTTRDVFSGTLDDISVYGAGLSAIQVANHYAASMGAPDDQYAYQVMSQNPIAYYRLDDAGSVLTDATDHRYNGTYGSAVTRRAPGLVLNISDTAASFPGGAWSANAIATVPQSTNLQPSTFSAEVVVKQTAANSGGYLDLVSYGPQSGGQAWSVQISPSNVFDAYVVTSSGAANVVGTTAVVPGDEYQVVVTYDGSSIKLYVNTYLEGTTSLSGNVNYSSVGTYGLSIGAGQSTSRNVFHGTLDEVSYYSGALTAAQVTAQFNAGFATVAQTGPPHVQTWVYYDGGHNAAVPLSYMLRYVDWVENTGDWSLSDGFRAAGGAHAVQYSDPADIYYCNPPFGPPSHNTPGSCSLPYGPLGDPTLDTDESAWLHGTGQPPDGSPVGARLHTTSEDPTFLYGEVLYGHSSHVISAYGAETTSVTNSHQIDAFLMDDSSPHYSPSDYVYSFGTSAAEYDSQSNPDAAYNADVVHMTCVASRHIFFNGPSWDVLDTTNGPQELSDDTAMLRSACTAGAMEEGTFVGTGFRKSLNQHALGNTFIPSADGVLLAQSLQKNAIVLDYAACSYGQSGCTYDPIGDRIYALAGLWLVYDPRFTIAFSFIDSSQDPNMSEVVGGTTYPDSLVAELAIVPTQPLQTATSRDITKIQVPDGHSFSGAPAGGTFRREFAQCYQKGVSIGHCAVVLNAESNQYTSGGVAPMPSLSQTYSSSLVLNDAPADTTGTAVWTGSIPTSLQPMTAVILKQ